MVYVDSRVLGYRPFWKRWMAEYQGRMGAAQAVALDALFDKYAGELPHAGVLRGTCCLPRHHGHRGSVEGCSA